MHAVTFKSILLVLRAKGKMNIFFLCLQEKDIRNLPHHHAQGEGFLCYLHLAVFYL